MKKMIIFDLDGTLLNTLEDLKETLNHTLKTFDLPLVTLEQTNNFIGRGIKNLILRASNNDSRIEDMYNEFMAYYDKNYKVHTKPYDGINEVIDELKTKYKLGVISNKNGRISKLLIDYFFPNSFEFVIGDKMGFSKKPDPSSIFYIMNKYNLNKEDFIYIGDSEVDIKTIKEANINGIIVSYGFRKKELLQTMWDNTIVDKPIDILKHIN